MSRISKCLSCGKKAHNFKKEEALDCVPPPNVLQFGEYVFDPEYRQALWEAHPYFVTEQIMACYFGKSLEFPSEADWLNRENEY